MSQWFKFYGGEYLADPKIATLSAQERSCWVTLLCLASTSSTPGVIEFLTVEVLLEKSGIKWDPYHPEEWESCLSVLQKFSRMKMIETSDDGRVTVIHWSKRQETAMTGYERLKKYRENTKQNKDSLVTDNEMITSDNGDDNSRVDKNRIDKSRIDNTISEGFEKFWLSYPKKVAKQDALRAWSKLKPTGEILTALTSGLEAWKKSPQWTKDDGRFIPNPATFLNGRRWEDEVKTKQVVTNRFSNLGTKI